MKKLMLLFFAAALMMAACNKPDPEDEWVEYLQRYKWEWEYSQDIATGHVSYPPVIVYWEFSSDNIIYYEYKGDGIPYKMNVAYDIEGRKIKTQGGDFMYDVEISENKLVLTDKFSMLNFKKRKRK